MILALLIVYLQSNFYISYLAEAVEHVAACDTLC
jgi:hypothetical protein